MLRYKRILLKLSGEALAGQAGFGLDPERLAGVAAEVAAVVRAGAQLGVVIGGGNFFRGAAAAARNMDRVTADYMGMLATVINALAFQDALESAGAAARVMTAIEMRQVAEPYVRWRAVRHLEEGRVAVFAGGTSNPYFSTDTAAALRALETGAELLAKATRVDGVFDSDPLKNPAAILYREISYTDVLAGRLAVMDAAAIAMCRDNSLPVAVFNLNTPGNIMRIAAGETAGTLIHP